ncbi:helix-turn-helix domain-containing protein [Halorussus salilacus]|uniref:LAGLIDADG family homing endonuclease n=1 Tax=Halorussus salilacus TaxID=2953750 RepID=UPI0020A00A76|nr:LAGLIDADG family homing endonuclease [Halorussus salilacus]USZ66993.1 helix-turn-helix domain-containing protein [Halorussus salilacus]
MARAENTELVDDFEQFYRRYYSDEIGDLAAKYPGEKRSLFVDWNDLYRYDADLADDYLSKPEQLQEYAEEALRLYDLPVDVSLGQAHVRIQNLPETTDIRAIRARHVNTLVSVQGIVRKATDVRPKIREAAFECQRCGTLTYIPQSGGDFQEPHECQGCERQGPFQINFDQSEFIDSQKLRVQESPEGLRGGETPQSIDVNIEDDITGEVTPGDHVTVTGVLHLEQQGSGQDKSAVFDVYMNGVSVTIEDEEFEDMDITDEDKKEIIELSNESDIYEQMVGSMAPAIYGYDEEKLAMILQLFSGVTKHLPDESRIRGDLHMLLIGDPGTGKCIKGDTKVTLADGAEKPIREIVESHLTDPKPIDDGVYQEVDIPLPSMSADGTLVQKRATKVWKREAPDEMYRIRTRSGTEIEVTPSHPLFVQSQGEFSPVQAEEIGEGDFIATPRSLPTEGDNSLEVDYRSSQSYNAVELDLPNKWTPKLARLLGYIIAEGYVESRSDNTGYVTVTNKDREILDDVAGAFDELGLNYTERASRPDKSAEEITCSSGEFVSFLRNLDPAITQGSAEQRVPDTLMNASTEVKCEFLRAYIDAEGHVSVGQREVSVASVSEELLKQVRSLLLSVGITSQLSERQKGSYRLRISGKQFQQYLQDIGFVTARKSASARAVDNGTKNTNCDVIPALSADLRRIRESLALSQSECGLARSTYQHYERGDRNPSRESLQTVVETFRTRLDRIYKLRQKVENGDWEAIETARQELNLSQQELADGIGVCQRSVSLYELGEVVPDGGRVTDARSVVLDRIDEALRVEGDIEALWALVDSDITWDRIRSIESIEPDYDWVYDLEVAGTHNYLTNNVVSHNSQMISYVQNIAPRSVYTSGKGSSSAGLTAAAVRDDFGDGQQWTLEAGALVLADKGIAAVDELDKMAPDDRSAMHEGLEQQKISVSKAGINATLKSRCSLLGAANPKYGRFDQYEPIGEQIDLEPALISRFDLIFTVTDQPDEEHDRRLAEHILQTNYAGQLNTQRTEMSAPNISEEEVRSQTEEVAPAIDADLLRKYIAYAKRNCFPTMTDEAMATIEDFYVDLRSKGVDEDAPVPVTARQLEALVRLAEASARVRLSDEVEVGDAERAVDITRSCLQDIGVDPETGQFDADVVETGTSKTQRDRIKNIKQLIADIEDEYDEGAPIDVVLDRAEDIGMDHSKAEHEIDKLKQKGEVYEPSTDHLRTT